MLCDFINSLDEVEDTALFNAIMNDIDNMLCAPTQIGDEGGLSDEELEFIDMVFGE